MDAALRAFRIRHSHIGGHSIDSETAQLVGADSIPVEGVLNVGKVFGSLIVVRGLPREHRRQVFVLVHGFGTVLAERVAPIAILQTLSGIEHATGRSAAVDVFILSTVGFYLFEQFTISGSDAGFHN